MNKQINELNEKLSTLRNELDELESKMAYFCGPNDVNEYFKKLKEYYYVQEELKRLL